MAPLVNRCWTLVLGAFLAVTVRADCEKECELCLFRLQGRQVDFSLIGCVQECEEGVSLCRYVATEEGDPGQAVAEQLDQIAKRYGGFMRRYGGFMKKSAEVGAETTGGLGKRYGGFMKKDDGDSGRLDALMELLVAAGGEGGAGEGEQRYGGAAAGAAATQSAEMGGGVRALQKRYGGFMRRVGSPTWEENKKIYEGLRKRSWGPDEEAGSPRADKRYGGFMD